ncbi:hypothetical protein E4T48_06794 [Aureobasidium sp. EXF-10727]|nr:hypothetical protein E4T48_06794 [Aureobasidium sp. EXF-10727]
MLTLTPKTIKGRCLSKGYASGSLLYSQVPLTGNSLAGKTLAIPSGRGSCSGSGVLLELLLNGNVLPEAPSFIFKREELILTLGTIIAAKFFDKSIPIMQVRIDEFVELAGHALMQISNNTLEVNLATISNAAATNEKAPLLAINLTDLDRAMLRGEHGKAV